MHGQNHIKKESWHLKRGNLRERGPLEDLGVDGRIFNKSEGYVSDLQDAAARNTTGSNFCIILLSS